MLWVQNKVEVACENPNNVMVKFVGLGSNSSSATVSIAQEK